MGYTNLVRSDKMDYEQYIRERISQLCLKKGVSEYKMSQDLGHSKSYIANIISKKTLPSMGEFLYMCQYLGVTPSQFFDVDCNEPILAQKITEQTKGMDEKKLNALLSIMECMK